MCIKRNTQKESKKVGFLKREQGSINVVSRCSFKGVYEVTNRSSM